MGTQPGTSLGAQGLRRAGSLAARAGRVTGSGLIAALCAAAFAPIVAADPGQAGTQWAALAGAVGGNVLTDVITAALARLPGGKADAPALSQAAVERALAQALERALEGGGAAGAAMRELAAGILRETGAVRAVLEGAASEDPDAAVALAEGLADLADRYGEFAAAAGDLRAAVAALEEQLARAAADRRADAERDRANALLLGRIAEAVDARGGAAERPAEVGCPYPGPAPFQQEDAALFFGRRAATRTLQREVDACSRTGGMLLVLGASGSGKSSLLRAGLAPALARQGPGGSARPWPVRVLTPTARPLAELAAHLADLAGLAAGEVEQVLAVSPERAVDLARQALQRLAKADGHARGRRCAVLVVDQFEELFTLAGHDAERSAQHERFAQALAALCAGPDAGDRSTPAVVVSALRGDHLERALQLPFIREAVNAGPFVLDAMTRAELRQAVRGPAAAVGVPIEPELVDAVVADAYGPRGMLTPGAGVLALVSQALAATWGQRHGRAMTLSAYQDAGGLGDAVDRGAQRVYEALDEHARAVARVMFLALTGTAPDTQTVVRLSAARADLYAAAGTSRRDGDAVLDAFAAERLLVLDGENVSICHDVLLDAWHLLHGWLQEDAAERAVADELLEDARAWAARDRARDYLYRRGRLETVTAVVERRGAQPSRYPPPPELAREFLVASRRGVRRTRRAWQAAFAALSALTLLAGAAAVTAQVNARHAAAQQTIALSRQLTADSETVEPSDALLARQLAVTAYAVAPTDQARDAVGALLAADLAQGRITTSSTSQINAVAFSPDGKTVAAAGTENVVRLWDATTEQAVRTLHAPGADALGQEPWVLSIAFSPDGKTLADGDGDGTVHLWNTATGRLVRSIPNRDGGASSVSFSPDGSTLAAAYPDSGAVRLWNAATGRLVRTIQDASADPTSQSSPMAVAFSRKQPTLAVLGNDGEVRLWNFATGQPGRSIRDTSTTPKAALISMAFSPDGSSLAVGDNEGTVQLRDTATGRLGRTLRDTSTTPDVSLTSMAFSPDGKTLATPGGGATVHLWDLATGRAVLTLQSTSADGVAYGGYCVAFSPDGRTLAAGDDGGGVMLWNVATGQAVHTVQVAPADSGVGVFSMAFSPDGRTLAAGRDNDSAQLWNTATDQVVRTIQGAAPPTANPSGATVAFSPDSGSLAVSDEGTVRLIDLATGLARTLQDGSRKQDGPVQSVALSPEHGILAVLGSDGAMRLSDVATGKPGRIILDSSTDPDIGIISMVFSPDGRSLATGTNDGAVLLFEVATGRPGRVIQDTAPALGLGGVDSGVFSVAFSPDGRTLAVGGADGTARLWNTATGRAVGPSVQENAASSQAPHAVLSVAFSRDGATLATGGQFSPVHLWPLFLFLDPESALCANVGLVPSDKWEAYAAGTPEPSTCAGDTR